MCAAFGWKSDCRSVFFFYSFGTFYTNKCIINGDRIVLNMWYRKVSKYRYFWRPQCTGLENSFDVCLKGKALLFFDDDIFWHLPKNTDIFYDEQSKISAFHMDFYGFALCFLLPSFYTKKWWIQAKTLNSCCSCWTPTKYQKTTL